MLFGRKSALEKVAAFLIDMFERLSGGSFDLPISRAVPTTRADDRDRFAHADPAGTRRSLRPAGRRTIVLRNAARLRHLAA